MGKSAQSSTKKISHRAFPAAMKLVRVEIEGNVKLIQAKKYSLALTDSGDMYIWGVKSNFGQPKMIKSNEKCK
jgi:hypothetical protein